MRHRHHIVPRHAGGSDDPENIAILTVQEHAEAHRTLWLEHGRWQDFVAWQGLAQIMTCEDVVRRAQIEGGRTPKNRETMRSNGSKLWEKPGMRAHISEKRREQSRLGKNPMQGKKQARISCLHCRGNFPVNGLTNHLKAVGFSVAK